MKNLLIKGNLKKHIVLLLKFLIVISTMWIGISVPSFATTDGSENIDAENVINTNIVAPTKLTMIDDIYYYEISTVEELEYITTVGGEWLEYNYILTNDIVLNDIELTFDLEGNLIVDESKLKK